MTTKQQTFKIGDRVRCIDDAQSFNRLRTGYEYVIEAAYDGSPTVIVNNAYHCLERFELVQEA